MLLRKYHKWVIPPVILLILFLYCIANNIRAFFVITGSMSPLIPSSSLIVSHQIGKTEYSVGSVIVYYDRENDRITAHRIYASGRFGFTSKGDANDFVDRYVVRLEDIIGEVIIVVPLNNIGTLSVECGFLILTVLLGVLLRKILLCLFKYGIFCPPSVHNPLS